MRKRVFLAAGILLLCTTIGAPGFSVPAEEKLPINPSLAEDVTGESEQEQVTATPVSTPTPNACKVSKVVFNKIATNDYHTKFSINADAKGKQSCMMDVIVGSFNTWGVSRKSHHFTDFNADTFRQTGSYSINEGGNSHKWSDDAVIANIWSTLLTNSGTDRTTPNYEPNKKYLACTEWGNWGSDSQAGRIGGGLTEAQRACFTGAFYVNNDTCTLVPVAQVTEQCGLFKIDYTASTPISLIFDTTGDPLSQAVAVDFKLDPSSSAKVWEWRASEKAPLLVYDPEHTGNITSASQLFGAWAFGGKSSASLKGGAAAAWQNGFEALGTLDTNRDGQVAGEELANLALWFDANRDGISQPGEVRSLESAGVIALFYSDLKTNSATGDVTASRGFIRSVNGSLQTGAAIDWIGVGTNSMFDLVKHNSLRNQSAPATTAPEDTSVAVTGAPAVAEANVPEKTSPAEGLWLWSVDDASQGGQGVFMLNSNAEHKVVGHTYTQVQIGSGSTHRVEFTLLEGDEHPTADGRVALTFKSAFPGTAQNSEAILSQDGMTMTGKTTMRSSSGTSLTYTWKAQKQG